MRVEQLSLFPEVAPQTEYALPPLEMPEVNANSSLAAAIGAFHTHMLRTGFAENTIKSFLGDLRLLSKFLGLTRPIGKAGTQDLLDFLTYLRYGRGVPSAPKSYARRVTTLKVFFGWLAAEKISPGDVAAPLVHEPAPSPLPEVLYEQQVKALLKATKALMQKKRKPDARPHLLVSLVLHTGLKKSEGLGIRLRHIDISEPSDPILYVRYDDPRKRKKERKLSLPREMVPALGQYLREYSPKEFLFECTARNLEYVLADAAQLSGLKEGVSFEALRMTCALRDYRAGMPPDKLREKLGLSPVTWRERLSKIKTLAAPGL